VDIYRDSCSTHFDYCLPAGIAMKTALHVTKNANDLMDIAACTWKARLEVLEVLLTRHRPLKIHNTSPPILLPNTSTDLNSLSLLTASKPHHRHNQNWQGTPRVPPKQTQTSSKLAAHPLQALNNSHPPTPWPSTPRNTPFPSTHASPS
jgi:hypothetical protein